MGARSSNADLFRKGLAFDEPVDEIDRLADLLHGRPSPAFSIDLPHRDRYDQPVDVADYVEKAIKLFVTTLGGATEVSVVGHYETDDERYIREPSTRVTGVVLDETDPTVTARVARGLIGVAASYAVETDQESVMLSFNNHFQLFAHEILAPHYSKADPDHD